MQVSLMSRPFTFFTHLMHFLATPRVYSVRSRQTARGTQRRSQVRQVAQDEYSVQFLDDLFKKYDRKMLSTCMLWEDQVRRHAYTR
jgi:hypothetical protein